MPISLMRQSPWSSSARLHDAARGRRGPGSPKKHNQSAGGHRSSSPSLGANPAPTPLQLAGSRSRSALAAPSALLLRCYPSAQAVASAIPWAGSGRLLLGGPAARRARRHHDHRGQRPAAWGRFEGMLFVEPSPTGPAPAIANSPLLIAIPRPRSRRPGRLAPLIVRMVLNGRLRVLRRPRPEHARLGASLRGFTKRRGGLSMRRPPRLPARWPRPCPSVGSESSASSC